MSGMLARNPVPVPVSLEEGEYLKKTVSVYYYNGAQWYEQLLQVGGLDLALILLGLALYLLSTLWVIPLCPRHTYQKSAPKTRIRKLVPSTGTKIEHFPFINRN